MTGTDPAGLIFLVASALCALALWMIVAAENRRRRR